MDKFLGRLFDSLERLYSLYEDYMWKYDDSRLEVLIMDNTISFYLYKNNSLVDEIIFSFDKKEIDLYNYICIRLMFIIYGNVIIHNDGYEFYNNKHKSYVRLIVNDIDLCNKMNYIVSLQNDMVINKDMDYVENMKKNLVKRKYSLSFIDNINDRIDLSKRLLRKVER